MWAACRPEPAIADALAAVDAGADLRRVATAALAQRVAPLVWRALSATVGPRERSTLGSVEADAARCRAHAQLVLPRLAGRALGPLVEAGLEPLVVKGAAITGRYPAPGLRPMDDVDVLVAPEHMCGALDVLRDAGWHRVDLAGRHHEVVLVHRDVPGLPVELHRALATRAERSNRLSVTDLRSRARPIDIAGVTVLGLEPEDELVLLAAHAAKPFHVFQRLLWSVDLAVVIGAAAASGRAIDWDRVLATAARTRCRTALAVGLTHAAWLGSPSPPEARTVPAGGTRLAALEPVLSRDWPVAVRDAGVRHRLRYALVDDRRLQLRLFVASIAGRGVVTAAREGVSLTARAVRRWRRLRWANPAATRREDSHEDAGDVLVP